MLNLFVGHFHVMRNDAKKRLQKTQIAAAATAAAAEAAAAAAAAIIKISSRRRRQRQRQCERQRLFAWRRCLSMQNGCIRDL